MCEVQYVKVLNTADLGFNMEFDIFRGSLFDREQSRQEQHYIACEFETVAETW